jgi:hypothetical protein
MKLILLYVGTSFTFEEAMGSSLNSARSLLIGALHVCDNLGSVWRSWT